MDGPGASVAIDLAGLELGLDREGTSIDFGETFENLGLTIQRTSPGGVICIHCQRWIYEAMRLHR